jgi:hypothetical protein
MALTASLAWRNLIFVTSTSNLIWSAEIQFSGASELLGDLVIRRSYMVSLVGSYQWLY